MFLADFISRTIPLDSSISTKNLITNDDNQESEPLASEILPAGEMIDTGDNSGLLTPTNIPIVSFQPILAASSNFILVNEFTKKRNQLICIDCNLNRNAIHCHPSTFIDALWCQSQNQFLLLTERNVFSFDQNTLTINLIPNMTATESKIFKCFTLFEADSILIAYDEWQPIFVDKWQYMMNDDDQGAWQLVGHLPLNLTINEFIGDMKISTGNPSHLAITTFNELTEQWRLEIRNTLTMECIRKIRLPGRSPVHDFHLGAIHNDHSGVDWLVFSSTSKDITVIYSNWTKSRVTYKHPAQRIVQFRDQNLIVRTTERVDIHLIE